MALTAQDKIDIAEIVADVLAKQPEHECGLCKNDPDAAKELGHIVGMIKDIGDGDISKGVEKLRSNTKFVLALREGVKVTRVELCKTVGKFVALAFGAGLVILFGNKILAAIEIAKGAGQ